MAAPFYRFRLPSRSFTRPGWAAAVVRGWLSRGLTPHQLALAVAVGGTCAFFPILGAATPLCALAALLLRLNQPVVQGINVLTTPLYPPAVLLFIRLGEALTGAPARGFDFAAWSRLGREHPGQFFARFGQTLAEGVVGWAAAAVLAAPLIYLAVRLVIRAREGDGARRQAPRSLPA